LVVENALCLGADTLDLVYNDGHDEVVATQGKVAVWGYASPTGTRPAVVDTGTPRIGHPPDLRRTP
jgi:hypothetical protein